MTNRTTGIAKHLVRLGLGAAFVASLLAIGAGRASAGSATGYVCTANYWPGVGYTYGNYGMVSVTLWSGPSCTGTYVGGYYGCTTGATSSLCPSSAHLFREGAINALAQNLEVATVNDQRLYLSLDANNNPTFFDFESN